MASRAVGLRAVVIIFDGGALSMDPLISSLPGMKSTTTFNQNALASLAPWYNFFFQLKISCIYISVRTTERIAESKLRKYGHVRRMGRRVGQEML